MSVLPDGKIDITPIATNLDPNGNEYRHKWQPHCQLSPPHLRCRPEHIIPRLQNRSSPQPQIELLRRLVFTLLYIARSTAASDGRGSLRSAKKRQIKRYKSKASARLNLLGKPPEGSARTDNTKRPRVENTASLGQKSLCYLTVLVLQCIETHFLYKLPSSLCPKRNYRTQGVNPSITCY